MRGSRRLLSWGAFVVALLLASPAGRLAGFGAAELPSKLTDAEFWQLSSDLSEPDGTFQSDNLLSNEMVFARIVPDLISRTKPGGVYLGVGPEQNFTYISAMKPRMVFITDIRRGNLHLQLMYKALFELSTDRADFVARLFTKKRPATLTAASNITDIMNAYWELYTLDEAAYAANLKAIQDHLTKTHTLPLPQSDLDGIARVYRAFYWYGPAMHYAASTNLSLASAGLGRPTYWDLMTQGDTAGNGLSYLGSPDKFAVMKDLESRNLVVPVVGNFSGPKALRAVGAYIKDHAAKVSAFYVSNVESYLRRDGSWPVFCSNVATFPLDETSVFIRPSGGSFTVMSLPGAGQTTVTGANPVFVNGTYYFNYSNVTTTTLSGGTSLASGLVPIMGDVKAGCGGGGTR